MSTGEGTLEHALTPADVAAANALTRRWLLSRDEIPSAASGLGIWALLTVLATGAVAETEEELLAAVGLDAERTAALPAALIAGASGDAAIRLAVAVWAGVGLVLDPEWTAGLPVEAVGSLTGDHVADKAALDAWASRNTRGLIESMPIDLDETTALVLASALSVRTRWRTPFKDDYTPPREGPWSHLRDAKVLTAEYHEDVLRVGANASVLTVRGEDDVDVLLAVGYDDVSPDQVMARLLAAANDPDWGRSAIALEAGKSGPGVRIVESYHEHPQVQPEIEVRTVGFDVTADLDLLADAEALGLQLAADSDFAQFPRLAAQALCVGQARQTCTATFDATGFEAAAVTVVGMAYMGGVPVRPERPHRHVRAHVTFDRPFAYLARHRLTGLVLVAGWVSEPARRTSAY